jgi:esterase/lipase superfamily enzyme
VTQDRLALGIKNMLAHSASQRVVILAHSQGTVITASLLDKVSEQLSHTPFRIDVITIGSPLTSLYTKFFDVSLGQGFARLCQQRPQQFTWQNICRRADYVGSDVRHEGIRNLALQTKGDHVKYWDDPVLLSHLAAVSSGTSPPLQKEIVPW